MRRGDRRSRFGLAAGLAFGAGVVAANPASAVADEAVSKLVDARIARAWSAVRGEFDPTADDAPPAPLEARILAAPPGVMPEVEAAAGDPASGPAEVAPGVPAIGYAPVSDGAVFPADRAFAAGPHPIAVPMPRRRPSVPTVATQVAALDAAAGVGASARLAEAPPILAEDGVFGPPKKVPKEALPYLHLIKREAARNKVPLWLAIGVGYVESKYDPKLRGSHTVVGIMQVMPSTARFQGYKGTNEQLFDPETNIVWGMRELGWTWAAAKGDPCLAVAKYKGGIMTKSISAAAWNYCTRAKQVTGML
jgi:soluble lytic murein transglycosylase-like protein